MHTFFPGTIGGGCCVFLQFKSPPLPSPMPKRWQRHCTILDPFIQLGWLFWQMALLHPPLFPPSAASKLACQKYSNFSSEASVRLRRRGRNSETDDGSLRVPPLHVGFVKKLHPKTPPTLFLMSPQDKLLIFCSVKNGAGLIPHFSFFIFL